MTLPVLRDDALRRTDDGFALRLSLPWIRSLPLASLAGLSVEIDGTPRTVAVRLGDRALAPGDLAAETGWWFVQDRIELRGDGDLIPGEHRVSISFDLVVPYLQAGPDGPLALPFRAERTLDTRTAAAPTVSRDVA